MNYIFAQLLFAVSAIFGAIGVRQKTKEKILILFSISTTISAIAFCLLNAYPGATSLLIMTLFGISNYFYDKKAKRPPYWLIYCCALIIIVTGLIADNTIISIIPIMASICYVLAISQDNESNIRLLTAINLLLFIIYDLITMTHVALIADSFFELSAILAILKFNKRRYHMTKKLNHNFCVKNLREQATKASRKEQESID